MSSVRKCFLACLCVMGMSCASVAMAQLSYTPAKPTALDTIRLRWAHVGCTNPDSVQVTMQGNLITVSADRVFMIDCGTVFGYFDEYTVGRLPSGEYDVQLAVNPPPPSLGPTVLLGPIHLSVGSLPATGSLLPHDNYADGWWDPSESGWGFAVQQFGDRLAAVWSVYDAAGHATWYTLQPGSWTRDATNTLRYVGTIYQTTGPYWGGPYDANAVTAVAVGSGSFIPQGVSSARFEYTIGGISGTKQLMRFVF